MRLRPSWSDGWWWLGSLYYEQDRFAEAQAALTRFVALAPNPGPAYAFLGLCEYETRDYHGALAHFQQWALKGSPGTDELIDVASFHWALLLTREGRFVQALYLLAAKAQKRGYSPALAEAMGLASLRMAKLPEEFPPEKRELVWLAGQAALCAQLRGFDRSDEYAGKLLLHYSREPNVHYFRGTLLGLKKQRKAEKAEYQEELRVSPQHVPAMLELAGIYTNEHQWTEGVSLAKRAVKFEPKNPRAHQALGRVLLAAGQVEESAQELETAKQLAPDISSIRFQLATVYRKLGRTKEAERELAAFSMLKKNEEVLASPEEVQKLLGEKAGQPR